MDAFTDFSAFADGLAALGDESSSPILDIPFVVDPAPPTEVPCNQDQIQDYGSYCVVA
ncbi:pheromone precursor Bbp1(2) [Schizophyllum commune]